MTATIEQLNAICITTHCWNKDKSKIAFCPDNNEVHIYKREGSTWVPEDILKEHDQVVTGIDWAPNSNQIVSCSHDRNAYVWAQEHGKWKPTLVILRITRGATQVRWSPDETMCAVSCGAKCVSVCYFEEENNWWVSKHIKKHKSTVLSVAWHPNSIFLATGGADFKVRVFSAWIKGVDKKPSSSPFGDKLAFGEPLMEINCGGWVHSVAWSPSGNQLAFVAHDSSISFVDVSTGTGAPVQRLALQGLPFRVLGFLSENSIIAAGYDCYPQLFTRQGGASWAFAKNVDEPAGTSTKGGSSVTAKNMWQNKVDMGTTENETELATKHQNAINSLCVMGSGATVTKFSTTGVDGKFIVWDVSSLPLV
jgi:actin related protein 2/3 complex subunit 1A/1B